MTATLLPSPEKLLIAFLAAHPDLVPLHGGRVGTDLTSPAASLRVNRTGGAATDVWEDQPRVTVECFGGTRTDADLLARTVIAAMPDAVAGYSDGAIRGWDVLLGPLWQPTGDTNRPRYLVDISLAVYP